MDLRRPANIRRALVGAAVVTLGSVWPAAVVADGSGGDATQLTLDGAGLLASVSTNGFNTGSTNGFFANLGTNGRTCGTCHVEARGWTLTPSHAQSLAPNDPLFSPNDGADCPPVSPAQGPDSAHSTEVLDYGLIRVQIGIRPGANYTLLSATNPKGCAIAPGSAALGGQLFLFRRPLPSTNLIFESAVMWDGRETLQPLIGAQDLGPLLFDLADQANGATTGHALGVSIAGTAAQADIVAFEAHLNTAQSVLFQPRKGLFAFLRADEANGGPDYLEDAVAPAFFIGVNDPLKPGFTSTVFDLYAAWEPNSPRYALLTRSEQAIGRGEAIFNEATFVIHDVPGLNSVASDPLYNPADPFAGRDIVGGCGICHNNPDVGNHSSALAINIGVTMAQPTNNDGSANVTLDIGNLPVYTLRNSATGATVRVTDPGKALISGYWTDIGKTKGPMLRGLAARAPYFHNGSARDLMTVVKFYDERFQMGLTPQQKDDLVAFLNAL